MFKFFMSLFTPKQSQETWPFPTSSTAKSAETVAEAPYKVEAPVVAETAAPVAKVAQSKPKANKPKASKPQVAKQKPAAPKKTVAKVAQVTKATPAKANKPKSAKPKAPKL